ncbi:unnamed protein product [Ostreobium quekettii]|uniref:BZIP domain-containing protein n=1 Tax=Ostreobium quekettii TaxID=121088 RepID=A0A8S1J727_9CHLO|nr:unnamed protein product [Ostreobium quekettii]CAD7699331.1 unnamed protein product [Ostreobium quekettii]|eukprot:evm.model.scf_1382.2 EVM.evm.TU.scf_1382.2   scf_1382:26768-29706(+)
MAEQRASLGGSVLQQLPREGGGGGSLLYSSHLGVQPLPGPGRRGDGEGGGADGVELSLQDFQSSGDGTNSGSEDGDSRGGGSCGHEEGDTRRARRILANRRSAQRSRTRRMQYIHEIERKVDKMRTESEAMAARLVQLRMHHQDLDHRKVELKNNVATLMARSQQREASCNQLQCEIAHLRSQLTGTSLRNPGGQGPPSQIATLPPTGGLLPGMLQAPFSKGGLGEAVGVDRGAADVQPSLLPAMRTGGLDLQRGPPYLDSGINMFPGGIPSQAVAVDTHEVDLPHNRPNRMMFAPMAGLGQGAHPGGGGCRAGSLWRGTNGRLPALPRHRGRLLSRQADG